MEPELTNRQKWLRAHPTYSREYYLKNKEKINAYKKQYKEENYQRLAEYRKQYHKMYSKRKKEEKLQERIERFKADLALKLS